MKEIYRAHPDNAGEIKGVLRSHGFHPEEMARLGKPDGGTVVDSAQVVLGVPSEEASEARIVLRSYFTERSKAIKGDSDTLKRSVLTGAVMGGVAAFAVWGMRGFEVSEDVGISILNWFLLVWLLTTIGAGWLHELLRKWKD